MAIYGPAGDVDAQSAYLFECDRDGLFAISLDQSGGNIPRDLCPEGWQLKTTFSLGVREAIPAAISPEPVLRGIRDVGYYIWREGVIHGTTQ